MFFNFIFCCIPFLNYRHSIITETKQTTVFISRGKNNSVIFYIEEMTGKAVMWILLMNLLMLFLFLQPS